MHKIGTSFHATVVGLHRAPFNNEIIHVHVPGHATFAPVDLLYSRRANVHILILNVLVSLHSFAFDYINMTA